MHRVLRIFATLLLYVCAVACQCSGCTYSSDTNTHTEKPVPFVTTLGVAPYAIQHPRFDCNMFWNSLHTVRGYHLSYLHNTFGDNPTCLARVYADPRLQSVQVHLMNEVCVRNRNCGPYEVLGDLTIQEVNFLAEKEEGWFMQRLRRNALPVADELMSLIALRPDLSCDISPGLESNMTAKAMRNVIRYLRPMFPHCTFTANPLIPDQSDILSGADFLEQHNPDVALASPCVFNNDGVSISFTNSLALYTPNISSSRLPELAHRFRNCDRTYFWHHSYNCINPSRFIDPRDRTCEESVPYLLLGQALGRLQNGDTKSGPNS